MLKLRLTGTRLNKFVLITCRKLHLVTVLYNRVFSECCEVKDGMFMYNGHFGTKNLYLPLENICFRKPEVGYI